MMQDRKALQSGTSHFLGQNFAKAADIRYQSREGQLEYAWTTSWGVSTRLIGALIMAHGDDNGIIMPPRLTPSHIVILPIDRDRPSVLPYCEKLAESLRQQQFHGRLLDVIVDIREMNAGEKSWQWIKKGIPLTLEIGPRDIQSNSVFVGRRDKSRKERYAQDRHEFLQSVIKVLDEMQNALFEKSRKYRDQHTREIDSWDAFKAFFTPRNTEKPEIHGGFARAHWCEQQACESAVNEELGVTIRCIPFEGHSDGRCVVCGKESKKVVIFAKAY
jgi:prolyl-tRNA synthetase